MSGYSATSRAAFERVDITAQQARVLSAFKPGDRLTRQELVTLTGLAINAICGRCKELLDAGRLESLPAVNGRHPLRLKEFSTEGSANESRQISQGVAERHNGNQGGSRNSAPQGMGADDTRQAVGRTQINRAALPDARNGKREDGESRLGSVDTSSEAYRHECEIRFVANLPNDGARNKYLTGVHGKRGEAAWKRLREDVWRAMRMAA